MYICICNAITDKMINDHLETCGETTNHKNVYGACSEGSTYCCGKCKPEIKSMVDRHNNEITVSKISDNIKKIATKTKETV